MNRPVDPDLYLRQIAVRIQSVQDREEMETLLDELDYLYDIVDPVYHEGAETLMNQCRRPFITSCCTAGGETSALKTYQNRHLQVIALSGNYLPDVDACFHLWRCRPVHIQAFRR